MKSDPAAFFSFRKKSCPPSSLPMLRAGGMALRAVLLLALVLLALGLGWLLFFHGRPSLDAGEQQWLRDHPQLSLGVLFHYPPYETYNLDKKYAGLSADYMRLLEQGLGVKFRLVRCVNAEDAARKFADGEVDALAAVTSGEELGAPALFTQAYSTVPAVIITRKDYTGDLSLESMAGMTVGLAVSEDFTRSLERRFPKLPFAVVRPEGGHVGGLRALSMGDFDALICDMAVVSHYIATAGISNLRVAGFTGYEVSHFMAVRADMPELAALLRKGLAAVPASSRQHIEEQWLGLQVMPLWQTRSFQWGVGTLTALLLFVSLWVYSLRVQVASRTALLSSINRVLMHSLGVRSEQDALRHCLDEACVLFHCGCGACGELHQGTWRPHVFGSGGSGGSGENGGIGTKLPEALAQPEPTLALPEPALSLLKAGQVASWHTQGHAVMLVALRGGGHAAPLLLGLLRHSGAGRRFGKAERDMLAAWVVSVEELLRRKRAEHQLKEKELQLQRGQRMEALGALAGGIAHDFNNILGSIVANGEMLDMFHASDEDAARKIRAILAAAGRGRDVVRRILHFTRREDEGRTLVWLGALAREVLDLLESTLPPGIAAHVHEQADDAPVWGNGTQLHQVLMNLCVNAVQAMQEASHDAQKQAGQLDISIYCATQDLHGDREVRPLADGEASASRHGEATQMPLSPSSPLPPPSFPPQATDGRYELRLGRSLPTGPVPCVVVCVRDSGPGMDAETMQRMFSPFFSTKAPGEGTGLGLAVVQSIVSAHQGCIVARSGVGRGTEFCLYLPQARDTKCCTPSGTQASSHAGSHAGTRPGSHEGTKAAATTPAPSPAAAMPGRILLVDDAEDFCQAAAAFLHSRGYDVTTAGGGRQGLALVQARPAGYDLVLTDYHMPDMTGDQVAAGVAQAAPGLPVIIITGHAGGLDTAALLTGGVCAVVEKPLGMRQLERVVARHMRGHEPRGRDHG